MWKKEKKNYNAMGNRKKIWAKKQDFKMISKVIIPGFLYGNCFYQPDRANFFFASSFNHTESIEEDLEQSDG